MKSIPVKMLLASIGTTVAVQVASAANTYNGPASATPDLLLAFRETGFTDLVIDIGHASTYLNSSATINLDTVVAAAGSGTYPTLASLLTHQFGSDLTGVSWSVCGSVKPGSTANDVYVTNPDDITTAVTQTSLTAASNDINNYGLQYANATAQNTVVANLAASETVATSDYTHFAPLVAGAMGFSSVEGLVSASPSICDFYTFTPNNPGVKAAGYFEIDLNGTGKYVIASAGPPKPTLTITKNGNTNIISFTGTASFTYNLHYTNPAGLGSPLSTWATAVGSLTGNGSTQSFTNLTSATDTNRFYSVSAH